MYIDRRDSEIPKWTAKSKLRRLSFSFFNVRRNWLTESSFLWRWRLPPVIEMCNGRELVYLTVWLQRFTYACYHWFWRRCRGHTGRSSWCWWPVTKRRELKSCCCVPPMFLAFLGSLLISLQVYCFFGDAKCLPSVRCGSFRASALGKCWLQTRWWSLMTMSWRPNTSIYCCHLALSWGKRCIECSCLSLEYSHKQRTYLQA